MIATRAIVFDFDGVLADSVPVKDGAFQSLFQHHDKTTQVAALAAWNRLKGVFRRDRIQAVHREVLGQTLDEATLDDHVRRFETHAFERTIAAPWIPGARAFLEHNRGAYPLYIVSASPQAEVQEVALRREMAHFFKAIYGGPVKKTAFLAQILQQEACTPRAVLFIGDSRSDHVAAEAVGTAFLGIVAPGNPSVFSETVPTAPDLTTLQAHITPSA